MNIPDTFMSFHMLCDQIQSDSSLTVKKEIIRAFVSRYAGDLGLLFKLLLPKQNGRLYYLQDKQLIKLLAIALGQTENTLKNHLNNSGCIGTTAAHFFKPRVPPMGNCQLNEKGFCNLTLAEFDSHLEVLSQASGEAQQLNAIQKFLNVACRNAVFTFFRSVKQDLHLGAGVRVVLEGLHPSANAVYKRCANIQEVVKKVQSGNVDADEGDVSDQSGQSRGVSPGAGGVKAGHVEASITMFMPLAPMLAAPSNGVDHVLSKTPNGAYSETKYDGERIQIHKQGSSFKFFARSLKPMKADKYEGLEKYLVEAVKANSCILDGEILLVDIATSKPLPFGTLGKHKKMQFSTACTCIFLFDIMYKDGKTLLDAPMDVRREYLKSSVQFIQNRVMISEMRLVSGTATERKAIMQKHLQYAVAEGLEGLVIKDIKSVYEPGSRHWIKLKKDYMQGMADSADLIVLGAWYGSGNKGGILSTFLMGVWDKTTTGSKQFKTVVKVGNGHDDVTLAKLNAYFKNSGRMTPGGPGVAPPPWIDVNTAHYPDVYIRPTPTADVWEISAAEFSNTKTHTANGVSMRFPRVTKIRDDKDLNTATSLQELLALMKVSQQKGSKLNALGAHQNVNSDDEEGEGAHEKGVLMRTSSKYDGPTVVVPGQHFGPLTPTAIEHLKTSPASPGAPSTLMDLAKWQNQPPVQNTPVAAQNSPQSPSIPLKQTPYWVFRSSGFKGDTPPPLPTSDEPDAPTTGSIEYVQGDIAQPRTLSSHPHQHLLLVHCCAIGQGMKWSQRGTMGTLSKFIGDEPAEAYTLYTQSGEAKVGDAILVECSNILNKGRLFVATILGQRGGQGGTPQLDQDAFEKALLAHLLPFAKAHLCSVHIPKLDRGTGVNWGLIDKILRYTYSRQHNLRVVVYQKGGAGETLGRQDSNLARQATIAEGTTSPSNGPNLLRSSTAAPAPEGFSRVATMAPHGASIEDQFSTSPMGKAPASNTLLGGVKAILFTVENGSSEPSAAKLLRQHITALGGIVLPHCTFNEDERALVLASATHIILPFAFKAAEAPEAAEVLLGIMAAIRETNAKTVVVRGEWVIASETANKLLPVGDYGLSKKVPPLTLPPTVKTSPSASSGSAGPLTRKYITIIGGSAAEQAAMAAMIQDMGGVVQDRLRMSDHVGAMTSMTMSRTGAVVSVPIAKTTHVIVKSRLKTEGAPTEPSPFREGSVHATNPLRTTSTTVHMADSQEVEAVNKALGLGVTVLTSDWLDDCWSRYQSHAPNLLPSDADYFVDNAVVYNADAPPPLQPLRRSVSILGSKRPRDEEVTVSMPPTPLSAKVDKDAFEPSATAPGIQLVSAPQPPTATNQTRNSSLPSFLRPSSNLIISVHGYGADDSAIILQQVGQLKDFSGPRSISVEGNLNLFCVKSSPSTKQQRILICEVLTSVSLPLLKGVAASCRRAVEEPLGCLEDYRSAVAVTSGWLQACVDAKAIVDVEPYLYRPAAAFSTPTIPAPSTTTTKALPPTPPLRASAPAHDVDNDNASDGSTDTASYCTFQAGVSAQGSDTEAE